MTIGFFRPRFRLLGPLELQVADSVRVLRSTRQRSVLAVLLTRRNQVVPVDALIEEVWNGRPPPTARSALHVHLGGIRRLLAAVGAKPLQTRSRGYLLQVNDDELDLSQFSRLVADGRRALASGAPAVAADTLRAALDMWRGAALTNVPVESLHRDVVPGWEEARLGAEEERIEADLACHRHGSLVGELRALVAAHPLRERLRGQLMVALCRSGRQIEALTCYRDTRRLLVEELGVEPGSELRRLEHAILTADPALDPPRAQTSPAARPAPVVQLPADIPDFVGRAAMKSRLISLLTEHSCSAPPVAVIRGKPGVGKTTLVQHVAHLVREHFPDGQLQASLRGSRGERRSPAAVTGRFLRALGVDASAVPPSSEERTAMYRTLLAGQRVLVVLDDATTSQLRPLIPGTPGSAVLATGRIPSRGVTGVTVETLDVLSTDESVELLAAATGDRRVTDARRDAVDVVHLCGRLPLAVRLAAARLAARPDWPVRRLVELLSDEGTRLDVLTMPDVGIRGSFARSEVELRADERQALYRLSLLDLSHFTSAAVAANLGWPAGQTATLIDRLTDVGLLDATGTDPCGQTRYRIPDLIGLHVRERAAASRATTNDS